MKKLIGDNTLGDRKTKNKYHILSTTLQASEWEIAVRYYNLR